MSAVYGTRWDQLAGAAMDLGMSDDEKLNLLAIFHYVTAGFSVFGILFSGMYLVFGIVFLSDPSAMFPDHGPRPPAAMVNLFGTFALCMGILGILISLTMASCLIYSGRCVQTRRHRTFSMVIGGGLCLAYPFGTVLGAFTLWVLTRPKVIEKFEHKSEGDWAAWSPPPEQPR